MIHSHQLSEETKKFASMLQDAGDKARSELEEDLKKVSDGIYDRMIEHLHQWFSYNLEESYRQHIAHEVRYILRELLNGNLEYIKNINLLSHYTFDNLHEIRLAIWRAAGQDIEHSIIHEQEKQIKELERDLEHQKRWNRCS